ncbi:MAG: transporter substrate-binding domain-containing protein [Clostridia bacterium]|nr:transporter substrate-binding domain-containing protein [Clostridia bacterium]
MKKFLQLTALVLAMLLLFAGCATNDADNKLVIGYTIYEPMNYMDDAGKLTGFDTEFAEAVCEKLDMVPEFVEINWDTKFVTLDADQIDCIWNGMTISDEVKTNCLVSKAYVKNAQVVVMAKDKIENYATAESLKGLKFAAEAGSAGEAAIKDNGLEENYTPVAAQTDALLAVAGGQADACVIDITMAKASTAAGTSYENLTYGVELTTEEYGIGFRKADTELKDAVDKAIDELYEDGTLTKLAEKYELNLAF